MNPFLKKEIRLLLPNFAFACVLALAGFCFPNDPNNVFNGICYFATCIFCPAVVVMLALSSFGVEVNSGTFANLLAQPVSRLKIWETKITLLAVAFLGVTLLWVVAFLFSARYSNRNYGIQDWLDLFSIVILTGLAVFSGGLWTVLLLRQVAAAFWFTLLVPGALMVLLAVLVDHDGNLFQCLIISVLGLYSLVGFFFARWLFMRAQDLQWSGGNIEMPELRGLTRFRSAVSLRRWQPRPALWRKEFMLHQSQLVMAFALAVLHGGVLVARHFTDKHKSPEMYYVLEIFWGFWLVLPLLVGCAAVAEERKLGTHEQQLCLPVKRRTQFAIKLAVVLGLSLVLGVAMPLLFEGKSILPNAHLDLGKMGGDWNGHMLAGQQSFYFWSATLDSLLPLLTLVTIALVIAGVSFFVSTLSRNTLQALAPAVLGLLATGFLLAALGQWQYWFWWSRYLWNGPLIYVIGVPLTGLLLLLLAAKNFRVTRPTWRTAGMNLLGLLAVMVLSAALTSLVYHRVWEKLTPLEPAHGAARLTQKDVRLDSWWGEVSVRMPDGKIWHAPFAYNRRSIFAILSGTLIGRLYPGTFYAGSNWVDIRRYGGELVGVKTDGTLWISEAPITRTKLPNGVWAVDEKKMLNLQPFGTETNWCCASPNYLSTLLVKTDGTLWRLGTNRFDEKKKEWPGLRAFTPYRLGKDSDWASVGGDYYQFSMTKTDGSIWMSPNSDSAADGLVTSEIEPGFTVAKFYDGKGGKYRSLTKISHGLRFEVGVREDGTFRVWADLRLENHSYLAKNKQRYSYGNYVWTPADYQIGKDTNWLALAGGEGKVVALKTDGTLWLWDFHLSNYRGEADERDLQKVVPVQLGSHSDWIAVSGNSTGIVALAADGSLWFWPVESVDNYFGNRTDGSNIRPWLDISRKPQWLGNVFAGQ